MPSSRPDPAFAFGRDPLFQLALLLYLGNRLLLSSLPGWHTPFLAGHFNDLLLVPAALPLFCAFYRLLNLRRHNRPPGWREIAAHTLVWSLFFEGFGPFILHHGTSDLVDVLAYAAGALVCGLWWNRRSWIPARAVLPAARTPHAMRLASITER